MQKNKIIGKKILKEKCQEDDRDDDDYKDDDCRIVFLLVFSYVCFIYSKIQLLSDKKEESKGRE